MLTFAAPMLLFALLSLPLLWWLLRLLPPKAKRETFPPTKILFDLKQEEETPTTSPLWLLLLRLTLAAALIFAFAAPFFNQNKALPLSKAPLLLILDNGWGAAKNFNATKKKALQLIDSAENQGRAVAVIGTAVLSKDVSFLTPIEAKTRLNALQTEGFTPIRDDVLALITQFKALNNDVQSIYLSDDLASPSDKGFLNEMSALVGGGLTPSQTLHDYTPNQRGFKVSVVPQKEGRLVMRDSKGLILFEQSFNTLDINVDLPLDLKNQISRIEIQGENHAGAVILLDQRTRKKSAMLISNASSDVSSPLLNPTYYLDRALEPFTERLKDEGQSASTNVLRAVKERVPLIILTDVGQLSNEAYVALKTHVEEGAMLVRFAGTRLANAKNDALLPVKLRQDVRQLGGALSWEQSKKLAPFPPNSPFKSLILPKDIAVTRQVLAEPDGLLADKTWGQLEDGTPLITADFLGKGRVVLFHITANLAWSDLPLSGLFLQMMEKIVQMAGTSEKIDEAINDNQLFAPLLTLNGVGELINPPVFAESLKTPLPLQASKNAPAGFYGLAESPFALNIFAANERPKPIDLSGFNGVKLRFDEENAIDFRPLLLKLAFGLLLIDTLIVLWLGGHLRRFKKLAPIALAVFLITPLEAQVLKGSDETRLVFVKTGKPQVDLISERGLNALSRYISARTTLEPQPSIGVDLERDELNIHAMIYFPILPDMGLLSAKSLVKLDTYMKNGGLLVVDTQDAPIAANQTTSPLKRLLGSLDIPELSPIPKDHVVTRTYFLIDKIVGRFSQGETWIEALPIAKDDDRPAKASDGVSPLIITSNDLAGAWATDETGKAMLPVEGNPRQRDMAFRAGVNIVFYALTGNYKADQVHAPALLERLGRRE